MVEIGECSGSKSSEEIWAKLEPSDSKYAALDISACENMIHSEIKASSHEKHEWCKITRNPDLCSATMQNKSLSSILVDDTVVPSEDSVVIHCGSEIIPGPDRKGYMSYRFTVISRPDATSRQLKVCIDIENTKCSICLNIWHDAVTVAPCFHNFCNGCFSEWLRRSQQKHSNVLCPQCRAVVLSVGRNHFLHGIAEDMVKADSSLKRSDEEVALLDTYASIRSNLVIGTVKKQSRKRPHSPLVEELDILDLPCPQCGIEYGGFQCNPATFHLQCHACGGMMPSRADIRVPQHCLGCDRVFCGAYWHSQRVTTNYSHPICSHETLKPISERTISRIPFVTHEKNQHEQDITERCIIQMGRTLQDVIREWVTKLNNREIDRTRMPLNHAETITAGTYICNECYDKLVSFLLYWFRVTIPRHLLPAEASQREDCWYGYACRTQHHNEAHARRRNHVCRPTR